MALMSNIPLEIIKPNPFRNFKLHPIDPKQVERLRASLHADGFWASVVGRRDRDGHYELAFGHHRILAAKAEKLAYVPLEVRELTDWHMVRMLTTENATQRGITAAAAADSVSAISKVMIYQCLKWDVETVFRFLKTLPRDAIESIWGKVRKGEGPGRDCIKKLLPEASFTTQQIDTALAVLKDSDLMGDIFIAARQRIARERAAETAKSTTSKTVSSPPALPAPVLKPAIFDADCASLFNLDSHLAEFRRIVTSETVRSYLPVTKQLEFAKAVIKHLRDRGREVTIINLREQCNILFYEMLGMPRAKMRTSSKRPVDHRIKDGINLLRRGTYDIKRGCAMLAKALEGELDSRALARLDELEEEITDALQSLHPKARRHRGNLRIVKNAEGVA